MSDRCHESYCSCSNCSLIFQWVVPYLISPDSADLGVKAAYIFAGFLVPLTVAIYFYYPEVCDERASPAPY